ncbi:unnamed protein product, partial [Rotaria magnacalcarata]
KDLDELREKCKSAIPTNERVSTADQRLRPKSSIGSAITRSSSATKCVTTASSVRPKSSKGTKLEKKKTEQKTVTKKKSVT